MLGSSRRWGGYAIFLVIERMRGHCVSGSVYIDVSVQPQESPRLKEPEVVARSLIYAEPSKGEVVGSLEPCMSLRAVSEADVGSLPRVVIAQYTSEIFGP